MTVFYILLPIGLLFVVVSLGIGTYEHLSITRGTVTEGRVVGNVRHGKGFTPRVAFHTAQGKEVVFQPSFDSNPPAYSPGDTLRVVYQGDGTGARILSFGTRFGLAWALFCAGLAMVVLAFGFRFGNDFVNSYYTSSTFIPRIEG
ncbi:MAG: DUF3592 domain-containing protein [Pyrinomonadaceae bacterium]